MPLLETMEGLTVLQDHQNPTLLVYQEIEKKLKHGPKKKKEESN